MEIIFWVFAVTGGAALMYLATHQWRAYNNRIFGGLMVLTVISVIAACFLGWGEPALTEFARRDGIARMYLPSPAFAGEVAVEPEYGSWFWWRLALFFLLYTILFLPAAFIDELAAGWRRFDEWLEQRTEEFELLEPEPAPAAATPEAPPGAGAAPPRRGFWARIWQSATDNIPDAIVADIMLDVGRMMVRRIF
ncbi:MAG: hypothetical protein HY378_01590 [Candidatus Brennerbacteria bacterium]|nr:hypothetical protein [Candidatus Brennerbacteria bacterium]